MECNPWLLSFAKFGHVEPDRKLGVSKIVIRSFRQAFSMFQWWFMNNFVFYLPVVCVCLRRFFICSTIINYLFSPPFGEYVLHFSIFLFCPTTEEVKSKTPGWWQLQIMFRNVIPRGKWSNLMGRFFCSFQVWQNNSELQARFFVGFFFQTENSSGNKPGRSRDVKDLNVYSPVN